MEHGDEDESLVLKGSALYEYLQSNGLTNFDTYEKKYSETTLLQQERETEQCLQITPPAPQWAVDHLDCILKCGLLLEDHQRFIESYRPLEVQESSWCVRNLIVFTGPLLWLWGSISKTSRPSVVRPLLWTAFGVHSLSVIFHIKGMLKRRSMSQAVCKLQVTLSNLEKVYVRFKWMLLLVHQNELINVRQRELLDLKKKLRMLLLGGIHKFFEFFAKLQVVPLSIDVDPTLQSLAADDINGDENEDTSCSLDRLKKLLNVYILVQSEFLRRLAVCFCPHLWNESTPLAIVNYSQTQFPVILNWSCDILKTISQEQRFFKSVVECKDLANVQKLPAASVWDFSDVYVSVRSANIHFQSLLIQLQGLQDILENGGCEQTKENKEFLNTIAGILNNINKDINSGQLCIDTSLVQILKMSNAHSPPSKISHPELGSSTFEDPDGCGDTTTVPPPQDEVFELTVPMEQISTSDEEEWNDITMESALMKKKEKETSKKVLLELKTVLVKKAEEWKEREKRALESKGIPYTPPEQVKSFLEEETRKQDSYDSYNSDESMEFLPTTSQNEWPLPRLKGNVQTHRSFRGSKAGHERSTAVKCTSEPEHQSGKDDESLKEREPLRMGFGASLLAEAMAKSLAMRNAVKEDVFLNSDEENSSED